MKQGDKLLLQLKIKKLNIIRRTAYLNKNDYDNTRN